MTFFRKTLLASLPLALLLSCSSDAPKETQDSCRGGRCDELDKPDSEVDPSPCDGIMIDESGRGNQRIAGRLNDPLANFAFKSGDDCPTTFKDIMAKLRINDKEGCADEKSGITTRVVSETAQAADAPTSYRLVTTRKCDNRETHELVFSLFGVRAGAATLPGGVEIIAFDKDEGVFNFYESDGRNVTFFGNSNDMILKGADGNTRRCAKCHNGGGLVMKELDTPWVHWEGHMDTPGAADLVSAHADLGNKATGSEFEGLVKRANKTWNDTRLKQLQEKAGLRETLRPLFCSVEVNIDNGADRKSPVIGGSGGDEIDRISFDSLLDPHLKSFGGVSIKFEDYDAQIKANGQALRGIPGVPNAVDTVFDYVFIERSNIDNVYVDKLKSAGIIDDEFIKDVLLIDMTRPVFSDDRCGLLAFAPVLAATDFNPEKIKQGFLDNLGAQAPGTPAAELRNNLLTEGGHSEAVKVFTDSCEALDSKLFVENALKITSLNRNIARANLPVFEFPQTMPSDNLNVAASSRLHPQDCTLSADFTAITAQVTPPAPEPEPEPEPSNDCAHDICENGDKLNPSCNDTCVAQICAEDPFCCNDSWDRTCVGEVESICSNTCN